MAGLSPGTFALVLEALDDPMVLRRVIGRLRPRVASRPHPRRRLRRALVRVIPGSRLPSALITYTMRAGPSVPCEPSPP